MDFKNLTIQQCAEKFEKGDLVFLPEDVRSIASNDPYDELDMASSIFEAIDYSNGFDREPCQKRVSRKDWILRKKQK